MGTTWIKLLLLYISVGDFITARYVTRFQDPLDFPGFFEDGFPSHDSFFGPWWTPDFDMLDFPPVVNVPRVEVHCDGSKLTLLVEKKTLGHSLSREELVLGDGCYSNAELPNQFVFSYGLDQCGTSQVMQDGFNVLTNLLHLNFKRSLPSWWHTPPNIHISCMPARSFHPHPARISSENDKRFNIRTMSPSWSNEEESHIYKRGHVINLQVSGRIRPDQQLFIQSCFLSASPESQSRPRHAVIQNKGCATSVGSPHPIAQFVASDKADVVQFNLNTSLLIPELYIHCILVISDHGVTCGAKSCNYNETESRWEDLSGDAEVCGCCSSKCKGQSVRNAQDAKASVSIGPLVIMDNEGLEAEQTNETRPNATLPSTSDGTHDVVVAGTSTSRGRFWPSSPGVVAVRQEPGSRRTVWLPGAELEDLQPRENDFSNHVPEPRTAGPEPPLTLLTNQIETKILNDRQSNTSMLDLLPMFNGWPLPPQPNVAFIVEEVDRNPRFRKSTETQTEAGDNLGESLPAGISVDFIMMVKKPEEDQEMAEESRRKRWFPDESHGFKLLDDEMMQMEEESDAGPIIRSKVEFSRGSDGSRKLSYEEEAMKPREGGEEWSRSERDARKPEPRLKGLRSLFMRLLRKLDKAE